MPKYTIKYDGYARTETVQTITADYYKHDPGWIVFKDAAHKVVAEVSDRAVLSVVRASE